ncbi:Lysine-tRNA ligase [Propionibacterium ruminifibrarum]|uniref:Lysine--tRNA ligase n=1 Tax=Propionibacterium ruminifibrarum TaxID=1962131 RepID=A0A375HZZ5_9ACTN|nr:bifunctional lysylphosphatidylglycerol synthetase/lysine--tRNA ligase LysX [Propionibacterium ruminifibrarum]SPF67332.1 Lysine-tRNA ligase [Propionibacterium ruminifibrarum]
MRALRRQRAANALSWIYAIGTVCALVLWCRYRLLHRDEAPWWVDFAIALLNLPVGASLVSVALMAVITHGLVHRKRLALLLVLLFQLLGVLRAITILVLMIWFRDSVEITAGTVEGPAETSVLFVPTLVLAVVLVAVSVAACALVIWLWPAFPARFAPGSWLRAVLVLLCGGLLATAVAHLLVLLRDDSGEPWRQTLAVLARSVDITLPPAWQGTQVGGVVPFITSLILGASVIGAVVVFIRTARPAGSWEPGNELHLRRLLLDHGEDDSLGYVSTRRERLLYFDESRRAAIGYQVFGGVALASGDPIGDPTCWGRTIESWHAESRRYGWTPAVLACSEAGARAYALALGFTVLRLGDEAVLDTAAFQLNSTAMGEVRRAWARARRDGLRAVIGFQGELAPEQIDEVRALAERWRGDETERGYSMELGRLGDEADPRIVVATVRDESDRPLAMMTFLPWGRYGLSLDLMRRDPQAPNGVNEFLLAELMVWGKGHAIRRVSLNFAFLRHVFAQAEDVAAAPINRAGSRMLGALDRFWQIQRLYRSNAKYRPEWRPRYLVLPTPLTAPQVVGAAMLAEGFLPDLFWLHRGAPSSATLGPAELAELRELTEARPPEIDTVRRSDQSRQRLAHLEALRAVGEPGYPVGNRNAVWLRDLPADAAVDPGVEIVGRVRAVRHHGGVCFVDLVDAGASHQLVLEADVLGRAEVARAARLLDRGDLVGVHAAAGRSRNGTPSLLVSSWQVLAKALQPIPWGGFDDPRARVRNRCLDLIVHPDQLELLAARSRAIAAVRGCLSEAGFHEVETPMLNTVHGGASARPFRTHINAYDTDLVLRIAPELALKRLVVAGFGAVFEIGKNFRNEGADSSHNPEFTVVEAYQPFADYIDMLLLTQRIIQRAAAAVHGREAMPLPGADGAMRLTDISGQWPRARVCDAVSQALGREVSLSTDLGELVDLAHAHGIETGATWGPGRVLEELYGELVEPMTVMPTFYLDFPAETSPLTAPHRSEPGLVERWDLVAGGMELGTAYSELADPLVQRSRLVEQSWQAAQGDPEAMEVDEEFLAALELGMPPTGGLGIGLDRLVMALTGATIRQVLSFPFVRPQR